jgi:hypothetical protein
VSRNIFIGLDGYRTLRMCEGVTSCRLYKLLQMCHWTRPTVQQWRSPINNKQTNALLSMKTPTMCSIINKNHSMQLIHIIIYSLDRTIQNYNVCWRRQPLSVPPSRQRHPLSFPPPKASLEFAPPLFSPSKIQHIAQWNYVKVLCILTRSI